MNTLCVALLLSVKKTLRHHDVLVFDTTRLRAYGWMDGRVSNQMKKDERCHERSRDTKYYNPQYNLNIRKIMTMIRKQALQGAVIFCLNHLGKLVDDMESAKSLGNAYHVRLGAWRKMNHRGEKRAGIFPPAQMSRLTRKFHVSPSMSTTLSSHSRERERGLDWTGHRPSTHHCQGHSSQREAEEAEGPSQRRIRRR